MAETITEWQRREFHDNVNYVYQNFETVAVKYAAAEMVHNGVQGNLDDFDVVGTGIARDKVDRHEVTVWGELEKSRRWCRPYLSYLALPLDRMDKVRSAISDINSVHTKAIVAALKAAEDKRYFTAATATAIAGETATGTASLPAGQQIAIGTTPDDLLTLAKIKSASYLMDAGGVPPSSSVRHWYTAPGQKQAIFSIVQATSIDFSDRKPFMDGQFDGKEFFGFMWHMIADRYNQGAGGVTVVERMLDLTSTTRNNLVIANDAIGVSRCDNLRTELDVLPQRTYSWQAFGSVDVNCVRVKDLGVVLVPCKEEVPA